MGDFLSGWRGANLSGVRIQKHLSAWALFLCDDAAKQLNLLLAICLQFDGADHARGPDVAAFDDSAA